MATLRILHLSDLQARGARETDKIGRQVLFESLSKYLRRVEPKGIDLILISGDIAESGKADEYEDAAETVHKLCAELKVDLSRVFPVPGNHDIDRNAFEKHWKLVPIALRKDLSALGRWMTQKDAGDQKQGGLREGLLEAGKAYRHWLSNLLGRPDLLPEHHPHSRLGYRAALKIAGVPIHIIGLDSAWTGSKDGDAFLGEDQVILHTTGDNGAALPGLRLCVMHHALKALQDGQKSFDLLQAKVDMVLHGHQHRWNKATDQRLDISAGWMFADRRGPLQNTSCNLVHVEWDGQLKNVEVQRLVYYHSAKYWFHGDDLLKLTRVRIKNVQAYKTLDLDLAQNGNTADVTLLLGDNSSGKSSLLRSVAMGLGNHSETTAMLHSYSGQWVRQGSQQGSIMLDLADRMGRTFKIETVLASLNGESCKKNYFAKEKNRWVPIHNEQDFPWPRIFVCGYGAGRTIGTRSARPYSLDDAVSSLFQTNKELQSPELSLHRLLADARDNVLPFQRWKVEEDLLKQFRDLMGKLFLFDHHHTIALTGEGLVIDGPEGRQPLNTQGDGYQNTAAWVLDLVGRSTQVRGNDGLRRLKGLVIIDEIEQHLHPRWQREIIQNLAQLFPEVQFLFTSHSPLCALGASSLPEATTILAKISRDGRGRSVLEPLGSLRGLRADQVLTDPAFELSSSRDPKTEKRLNRFAELFLLDERTTEQEHEFTALEIQLKQLPSEGEHASTRVLEAQLKQQIAHLKGKMEEA